MSKTSNITNLSAEFERLKGSIKDENINNAISLVANNELLKVFFGKDALYKHVDEMAKQLSPQVLYLYLNFVNNYDINLASPELLQKIQRDSYNYQQMFDRIMSTLSRFSPKQQDYIVLKSIDVASQVMHDQIVQNLIALSNNKANTVILILELLRSIEPFIVRVCQEVAQGVVSDKQIDEFLAISEAQIAAAAMSTDQILDKMSTNTENNNSN